MTDLAGDTRQAWQAGRRPWIALAMCLLSAACAAGEEFTATRTLLARAGDVYASLPITGELARLPLSAFLPTADLPLWGALLQTALVIGIAEMLVGRMATLCVASAGQLLSTLTSRYLITLGAAVVIGLPLSQAGVLDTGPSGISTAVGGWLLAKRGAYVSLTLLILAIAAAAALQPNLDGREHAAALAVGVGAAAVTSPTARALPRRTARGLRETGAVGLMGVEKLAQLLNPLSPPFPLLGELDWVARQQPLEARAGVTPGAAAKARVGERAAEPEPGSQRTRDRS